MPKHCYNEKSMGFYDDEGEICVVHAHSRWRFFNRTDIASCKEFWKNIAEIENILPEEKALAKSAAAADEEMLASSCNIL